MFIEDNKIEQCILPYDFRLTHTMTRSSGIFSENLLSLRLQLETLFEDVGGEHALSFLNALSKLSRSEQEIVLGTVQRVVERVAAGEVRFSSEKDRALKDFEERLYNDIIMSMQEAAGVPRLAVVNGGKNKGVVKPPIDLAKARKDRKTRPVNPVLN